MKTLRRFIIGAILVLAVSAAFSQARVQFIHNSADEALSVVDIWIDQKMVAEDFHFRSSTPFIDATAGQQITVSVVAPDSPGPENPLWSGTYTLNNAETYLFVADGILSTTGYDPAPPFGMQLYTGAREQAAMSDQTDVLFHHGSTDAPALDIFETGIGLGQWVNDLAYTSFDGYIEEGTKDYMLEVRNASNNAVIGTYKAEFQNLGWKGYAVTVLASGFMDPASNSNGAGFGLWAALSSGGPLVELPLYDPKAWVQFIHNSADPLASVVDVWADENLIIDNFSFRTASPFIELVADREVQLAITDADSQNPNDPLYTEPFFLGEGGTYVVVAEGILSPSGYNPPAPFDLTGMSGARQAASLNTNTDILIEQGSTDAPVMDIYETKAGLGLLADDLAYAQFDGYNELATANFIFEVRNQAGTVLLSAYRADFQAMGLMGEAVTMVASGFMDPSINSNGPEFGLWLARAAGGPLIELPRFVPTARVQFIHNSPDALAEVVDVWVDDELVLDNLGFRTASPFLDIPAGIQFTLSITDADSQGPESPLWSNSYTLVEDAKYVLVAEGILSPHGYDPAVPFGIAVYPTAREQANVQSQADVLLHHGTTDCPTIDVIEIGLGIGTLANDLAYSQFAGYLNMAAINYIFQIKDYTGLNKIAAFQVPLGNLGMQGKAITLLTSGFLEPENNSNGPEFGLWLAQASGGALLKMPVYDPSARVQFIHNSADTALSTVDVWVDGERVADNLDFRHATPYFDAPAIESFMLSICDASSQNPYTPLWVHNFTLTEDETYVFVGEGLVTQTGFDPFQPYEVAMFPQSREAAGNPANTDILFSHGATDQVSVDIFETKAGLGQLADNLGYGGFEGYNEQETQNYIFELRDQGGAVLGSYRAALETFQMQGDAVTVVLSGFADTASNSGGAEFGLWGARSAGGALVEFPLYAPSARVQFINNCPDENYPSVDIWMNQTLLLDDFDFRTATPFQYLPAMQQLTIAVKGPDSQDPGNPLWSQNMTFVEDQTYILTANGILSSSGYDPLVPFKITLLEGAREYAANGSNTDVIFYNGSTDASAVDINIVRPGTVFIVDNLDYDEFDDYTELAAENYSLEVRDESGSVQLANFAAPFADMGLAGKSLTILVSGFLEPSVNSGGAALGLMAVEADGTVTMLINQTGIKEAAGGIAFLSLFPNPADDVLHVSFELKKNAKTTLRLTDLTGRTVSLIDLGYRTSGSVETALSLESLPAGMYLLNITSGSGTLSSKIMVK